METIYIGGGSPALTTYCLIEINKILTSSITLSDLKEYTIECNPLDITEDLVKLAKLIGCNRISLGIQSFSRNILKAVNRGAQSFESIIHALEILSREGFNVSIDLINGLPGLEISRELKSLEKILKEYNCIKHISFYELSIDEGSKLYLEKDNLELPTDSILLTYESELRELIKSYGFERYEVSNYCKPGFQSKHNLGYWMYNNYLGLGPGAHSTIGSLRIENIPDLKRYISNDNFSDVTKLSLREQIEEYLLMGLRLTKGIDLLDFKNRFGKELCKLVSKSINAYKKEGDLIVEVQTIRLSRRGMDIINRILVDLFIELESSLIS